MTDTVRQSQTSTRDRGPGSTELFGGSAANVGVSASMRVYLELRREIMSLQSLPGTTLDRVEIAERFRVSQSPVREAIKLLEQDGLVVSFPQSRTVVTRIDPAKISEEHFLRSALECEVVRRLAEAAEDATVRKLRGHLRLQKALVGDVEQIDLFKQLDDTFHETLFESAGQTGLHRRVVSRSGHLARARTLDLPQKGKMRDVFRHHTWIVDAVAAGDPAGAAEAMRKHLSGTIDRISELRLANPDYFENSESTVR